jgi:ABC-type branched-subunit amino acid transport system ATPase component/branched-subunit amino acid ABC-type transport system permease component
LTEVVQFALYGVALGAMYALASQGLIVIYRGSGVLNFALGATGMVGAFLFYDVHANRGWSLVPSLALGLGSAAAIGALTQLLIMRKLRQSSSLMRLVATLAVLVILQSAAILHYSTDSQIVTGIFSSSEIVHFGPHLFLSFDRVVIIGIAALTTALLWGVYKFSRFGLATTAVAEDEETAAAAGVSTDRIALANWIIGSVLAAVTAILLAPIATLQVSALTDVIIAAFAGALVAGFRSFPLALVGAIGIGILQSELSRYVTTTGVGESAPFAVVLGYLVVRGRALPTRGQFLDKLPSVGNGRVRLRTVVPLLVVASALTLWVLPADWLGAATTSVAIATVLLSLVVVTGYAGQISLAQFTFAGIGALIAGRLAQDAGFSFLPALVLGVVATFGIGMLFGIPALRTRGVNLAIATLGLGVAVTAIVFGNYQLVGGFGGTQIGSQHLLGLNINSAQFPARYALVTLLVFAAAALMVAAVRRGRVGRRLIAIRENERAAAALGVNVLGAKLYAFGLGAGLAALGGILLAFQGTSITYDQFDISQSINAVSWAVIGGIGYIPGALAGSLLVPGGIFQLLIDQLTSIDQYIPLAGGVLLLVTILLNPDGLVSGQLDMVRAIWRRLRGTRDTAPIIHLPNLGSVDRDPSPGRRREGDVTVENLVIRFGGVVAVDHLSLRLSAGEVVGLIGPNGAGKTTAIDAITGFVRATSGQIVANGTRIDRLPPYKRARKGIVRSFQSLELFEDINVFENLQAAADPNDMASYATNLIGLGSRSVSPEFLEVVADFGLEQDLGRLPLTLPYGRRRLVAIARAVASAPDVLLLDEPASGLDEREARELVDLVADLARRRRMAILLVEHNMDVVMQVCDRITVLDFGKTIAVGTPTEIRNDPAVRAAYLGDETAATNEKPEILNAPPRAV